MEVPLTPAAVRRQIQVIRQQCEAAVTAAAEAAAETRSRIEDARRHMEATQARIDRARGRASRG